VVGGMVTGTVLAIFFVPLFFVLIRGLFRPRGSKTPKTNENPNAGTTPALNYSEGH
jgi:multidrug efflux pump